MIKITTERGTLFTGKNGQAVLRWKSSYKREEQEYYDKLQMYIDNTVARNMDAYVPFRTGVLKKSVILGSRMGSGKLVYIAPYAHKRYYSSNNRLNGKRGSKWFDRMWAARKNVIVREVQNYSRGLRN